MRNKRAHKKLAKLERMSNKNLLNYLNTMLVKLEKEPTKVNLVRLQIILSGLVFTVEARRKDLCEVSKAVVRMYYTLACRFIEVKEKFYDKG